MTDLQTFHQRGQGFRGVDNAVMIDEMMTPAHRQITHYLNTTGAAAPGKEGFDMRGAATRAQHQHACAQCADLGPAHEQNAAGQYAAEREAKGNQKSAASQ